MDDDRIAKDVAVGTTAEHALSHELAVYIATQIEITRRATGRLSRGDNSMWCGALIEVCAFLICEGVAEDQRGVVIENLQNYLTNLVRKG